MEKKMKKGSFVEGHNESIGKSDNAGMPKEVVMKPYPKTASASEGYQDDSMSGVDYVQDMAASKRRSNMSYQK